MLKKYVAEMSAGLTANTWWEHANFGSNKEASIALKDLLVGTPDLFQTPKPEKLIQRVLELAPNAGDIVLDSFLGSGTTAAVAHKMAGAGSASRWATMPSPTACRGCARWSMASRAASAPPWAGQVAAASR